MSDCSVHQDALQQNHGGTNPGANARKEAQNAQLEVSEVERASPRNLHGVLWTLVILATLSSIMLNAFDNTIVANIIPSIVEDLGHAEQLAWISVGYPIGALAVTLPLGRLYGIFNTKWLYITMIVLFMAGSALCGAAPNLPALIVGRVVAGAGGNGMYLGVVTLISVNTTEKERPTYLALTGLVYGIGTIVGPIIGGAFAVSPATWRWGFYINLVIGAAFAPIYVLLVPTNDPRPSATMYSKLSDFDYLGATLQVGFFVSGIMAINFGGTLYAWNSGTTIALFVVFAVLLAAFAVQQSYTLLTTADSRMFPVHFLKMKEPVVLFVLMAANNASTFVLIYYIPLYFQLIRSSDSLRSGVQLLALIIPAMAAIMVNGAVMSKTGHYQPWYVGGSILLLVGGVLLSRIGIDTPVARIYGYEVLLGIAVGSFLQTGYAVIQGVLDSVHMSYALAFMLLGQLLGILCGLSISGSIFLEAAISGLSGDFFETLAPAVQAEALQVLMTSLQKAFILVYVAGAVSLVASLFLSRQKLNLGPVGSPKTTK